MNHTGGHEDDEPLIPLMDRDNGQPTDVSKQKQGRTSFTQDASTKSSKLSGSTAHDSISSESDIRNHHHHHHHHRDSSSRMDGSRKLTSQCDQDHGVSALDDDDDDDDDDDSNEPTLLESQTAARDKRRLQIAIGLCSTFFVVELIGGLWSDSLALLSDSFHLLTDITSFVISLSAIYLSRRSCTSTHTFGYHRAEVLGALASIFLIWGLTFLLAIEACDRVKHPLDIDGKTMSIVAGLGVFVNVLLNITAATLHVLGDLLSSIGVLISSLVITFFPSLTYLDPICTFVFSILVIGTTIGVFKRSIAVLMETVPRGMDLDEIKEAACDIPGVLEVKSLKIWSLTIGRPVMAGTVYLQPEIKDLKAASVVVTHVKRMLRKRYGIRQSTVQVALYTSKDRQSTKTLQQQQQQQSSGAASTTVAAGNKHTQLPMDALARHDQDIIFSIDDDELQEEEGAMPSSHRQSGSHGHSHSHLQSHSHSHQHTTTQAQQITRSGTPLSQYRENRHTKDDDDESEAEMEQESLTRRHFIIACE
ncbi:hypothetical protein BGX31_004958 [Mortierella sp. GBA43]|nr:hypothetical protein BGX31_004958 [Mortierella sp. GBA43]